MEGYTVTEIPVTNNPRLHGQSKYGVGNRLFKSFRDLLAIRWMKSQTSGDPIEREDGGTKGGKASGTLPDQPPTSLPTHLPPLPARQQEAVASQVNPPALPHATP